jgi:surface antigen
MTMKTLLMGAMAAVLIGGAASAQPYDQNSSRDRGNQGGNQDGNYNRGDQNTYSGNNGRDQPNLQQDNQRGDNRDNQDRNNGNYYRQGAYEQNCHRGNQAAGTIFGALAGGLIGSAASHGNGGAVIGGAVLGGLLGNTISKDISCDSQPYAYRTYSSGLNGDIGRRYDWNHGQERGYFVPTREFRRDNTVCRDFTETTYANGNRYTRSGTSCRSQDGNWRFD